VSRRNRADDEAAQTSNRFASCIRRILERSFDVANSSFEHNLYSGATRETRMKRLRHFSAVLVTESDYLTRIHSDVLRGK
jgi:hypothetical protein